MEIAVERLLSSRSNHYGKRKRFPQTGNQEAQATEEKIISKTVLTYQEFYTSVVLPPWAPPAWLFGVAWSVIYPLSVVATVYGIYLVIKHRMPVALLWVLAINWIANLLFTPIQLGLRPLWPASLDILIVLGSLLYFQARIRRYSTLIFWLLVPYVLWGIFATILQLTITTLN